MTNFKSFAGIELTIEVNRIISLSMFCEVVRWMEALTP